MDINILLFQILNGVQFGVLIALLATGLSLIFGMLGIINFAHGSFYMLGAYLTWLGVQLLNMPGEFWFSILLIFVPLMGIVGFLTERFLLRRMYDYEIVYQLLLTFGILLVIQQGVGLLFGTKPLFLGIPSSLTGQVNLGLFKYPVYRLLITFLGLAIIFAVWLFIEHSRIGAMIRASAEDSETVQTLGINPHKIYTLVFTLGTILAGLGGALHAPMIGGLQHYIGSDILLICFIVVVIGGMGSIRGALLGGIILGLVRGITGMIWAPISDFAMFIFMGGILLFRPQGLFGKMEME
jgi:branched-chain amino acid transport system permease protein